MDDVEYETKESAKVKLVQAGHDYKALPCIFKTLQSNQCFILDAGDVYMWLGTYFDCDIVILGKKSTAVAKEAAKNQANAVFSKTKRSPWQRVVKEIEGAEVVSNLMWSSLVSCLVHHLQGTIYRLA